MLTMTQTCCGYCQHPVDKDKPVKVWSEWKDTTYHNACLEAAMEKARKFDLAEVVVNGPRHASVFVGDVWVCNLCGGRTAGYGPETCRHCGAKAHYGSNNGHYEPSHPFPFGESK